MASPIIQFDQVPEDDPFAYRYGKGAGALGRAIGSNLGSIASGIGSAASVVGDQGNKFIRGMMGAPVEENQVQTDALKPPAAPHNNTPAVVNPPQPGDNITQQAALGGGSHIRYQLPGGEWKEYNAQGATRADRLDLNPEGPPAPSVADGPNVSVMSRLNNSVSESQLDDAGNQAELARAQALTKDPFAAQKAGIVAQLDLMNQRQAQLEQGIAPLFERKANAERELSALHASPEYRNGDPKRRAQIDAHYGEIIQQAKDEIQQRYQEHTMASNHPIGQLFRQN